MEEVEFRTHSVCNACEPATPSKDGAVSHPWAGRAMLPLLGYGLKAEDKFSEDESNASSGIKFLCQVGSRRAQPVVWERDQPLLLHPLC